MATRHPERLALRAEVTVAVQEDGYMHSILVPQGQKVPVGTPIALMTEYEEDLRGLDDYKPPKADLYRAKHRLRMLTWQSYLKGDKSKS